MTFIYKHFTIKALRFYICAEYNLGQLKCTLPRPGRLFLTGESKDIELLRRKPGFTDPDPEFDKDKSSHNGNVRYDNEALHLWAACPGLADARWIAESISWVDWPKRSG